MNYKKKKKCIYLMVYVDIFSIGRCNMHVVKLNL
jgi:hypothetical protein